MSLATATAGPEAPDQPTPVARWNRWNECLTWYRVEHSMFKKKPLLQLSGVDAEYHKYTLSGLADGDIDIMWFWEVRPFLLNSTLTHLLNRPIRMHS